MSRYPERPLEEVLTLQKRRMAIDDESEYQRIRVQLHQQGVILRDVLDGADLKTKTQQVCQAGDVVFAEIDAKVGGYGVVPPELDGALVSSHYFLFRVNPVVAYLPYVGVALRWPGFQQQIRARGSTNYAAIRPGQILQYTVPLPDLEEQRRIAARLERLLGRVGQIQSAAAGTRGLLEACAGAAVRDDAPQIRIGELLVPIERSVKVEPDIAYAVLGAHWYAAGLYVKNRLPGREIAASKLYEVREGDFVYNRLFAWKGAFAVATHEHDGCFVSGEFPTYAIDRRFVEPAYLIAFFSRPSTWDLVLGKSTGSTPTSRNRLKSERLLAMTIPLPPIEEQRRVAAVLRIVQQVRHRVGKRDALVEALPASILNQAFNGGL